MNKKIINKEKPECRLVESSLGVIVKEWLLLQGYEIFEEVQILTGGQVADIVAIRGKVITVVELKTSLNLTVLAQSYEWLRYSTQVYAAFYVNKNSTKGFYFAQKVAKSFGIGLLAVGENGVIEILNSPKFNRHRLNHFRDVCNDILIRFNTENNIKAGSKGVGYLTNYKKTINDVIEFLKTKGEAGATIYEILRNVPTHYKGKNIHSSLQRAIINFERERIFVEKIGNNPYIFSIENKRTS